VACAEASPGRAALLCERNSGTDHRVALLYHRGRPKPNAAESLRALKVAENTESVTLRSDLYELDNLLQGEARSVPSQVARVRERVFEYEQECLCLREELGVVPSDRGFVKGWE
jgi:hypothetical protein